MSSLTQDDLRPFIVESNNIEGITRPPTDAELFAAQYFVALDKVTVAELALFVETCEPGARLRARSGMDVFVGSHMPPKGGPQIANMLNTLLEAIEARWISPFRAHVAYEKIHPFTDGNGRSGRILWAWQMYHQRYWRPDDISFLHMFYYQTLSNLDMPVGDDVED